MVKVLQNESEDTMELRNKDIKHKYAKIISIGYCDAQWLLKYQNRIGYTCGVYGWNYDLFVIGDVAICTGYRNTPSTIKYDYELLREYEKKAEKIAISRKKENESWDKFIQNKEKKINKLLNDFIGKIA